MSYPLSILRSMELYVLSLAMVVAAWLIYRGRTRSGDPNAQWIAADLQAQSRALERLATQAEERRRLEEQSTEAVRDVQRLLAGSFSKGKVGENVLGAALSALPQSMVVRDFKLSGGRCEFALRMSDGKLLPVDSKWSALELAKELEENTDLSRQTQLQREAEKVVAARVKEVSQYLDPALTLPMAVAAVPDSVYSVLKRAHGEAQDRGVVIVAYSTAVPFLLSIWNLHRTYGRDVDDAHLAVHLRELARCLGDLESQVEGRLSKGMAMVDNAVGDMRSLLGSARTAVQALERGESTSPQNEEEPRMRAL